MDPSQYTTNDLSFAAYLCLNGIRLIKASKLGRSYVFLFEASDKIPGLKIQFVSSESAKFDAAVRNIKRLLFGDRE
jgi:hypothetical protein